MALRNFRRSLSVLILGILGSQLAGCSFLFSKGPPSDSDYRREMSLDCSGYTLPVLDTIWAGLNGLGALTAASMSQGEWDKKYSYSRSETMAVGLVWLGISGASAIYGYTKAHECSEAMDEASERPRYLPRPRRQQPSYPVYSPPPQTEAPSDPWQSQPR